ncbi:ATPase AAA [Clostridia bacterium]|nr:ATPase AAA [Clostridia bacterium]
MGHFLNRTNKGFQISLNSEIYVDKTGMISYANSVLDTERRFFCVSRPRRFGKSMAANMLAAYYCCDYDSRAQFKGLKIESDPSFETHLNKYNVIFLNMQNFLSGSKDIEGMIADIEETLLEEMLDAYPDCKFRRPGDMFRTLRDIAEQTGKSFVVIIDEWDCIFRVHKNSKDAQDKYLDFLRNFMKDNEAIALAYMTGILPIRKYGTHSALNMFAEVSMTNPKQLAEYMGFTDAEVRGLCERFDMDYEEVSAWYNGYRLGDGLAIYSPKSVVDAMLDHELFNYWNSTETYEALLVYIEMNIDGLKDTVVELLAGGRKQINTGKFANDMVSFGGSDDVLTLLVHLGYLGYDKTSKEVFIPNKEVFDEFFNAVSGIGWGAVEAALLASDDLMKATWALDAARVASGIENAHLENAHLTYNDENALSYTLSLAYYTARNYYTVIREMPTGKGFADMVFIPRKRYADKPAMIVELKWNRDAGGAIAQIKDKQYFQALEEYKGNLLLVGVNYDKDTRAHECVIEEVIL